MSKRRRAPSLSPRLANTSVPGRYHPQLESYLSAFANYSLSPAT